jgi:hypothetical protein
MMVFTSARAENSIRMLARRAPELEVIRVSPGIERNKSSAGFTTCSMTSRGVESGTGM